MHRALEHGNAAFTCVHECFESLTSKMSHFKKLNTKIYQKSGPIITPDYIYWKKLGVPVLVKEFGPIDYIDFSPIEPHYFAVTCSVRVQVYNPVTKLVVKNLSRFRENAYGATFRNDGKLLCSGGEESVVKLFDVASKSLLRLFKGHTAPVHRTYFVPARSQIASFSDDKTVKIWDIPTEKYVLSFEEHTDYIRAGAMSPVVPDIVLSGSYDNTVKMYDSRTKSSVLSVNHGSPVEALLYLPSGGIFLSAGGTDIKVWDTLAGGKLLGCISQHHKTITCLRLASDNKRLLSGSLDRHVKIYDLSSFKVVHTLDYPNAVLSLGVSKNDDTVVAGLVDGLVSVCRRTEDKSIDEEKKVSYKYATHTHSQVDVIVPQVQTEKQAKYDICLRKFEYNKALDCVLLPYVANKNPQTTVSVMQELIRRKALARTMAERDNKTVSQLLRFFIKNITDYRFTRVLINVVDTFLDLYEDKMHLMSPQLKLMFLHLSKLLIKEVELGEKLATLQGTMQIILAASNAVNEMSLEDKNVPHNIVPSAEAQKNLIVNLT